MLGFDPDEIRRIAAKYSTRQPIPEKKPPKVHPCGKTARIRAMVAMLREGKSYVEILAVYPGKRFSLRRAERVCGIMAPHPGRTREHAGHNWRNGMSPANKARFEIICQMLRDGKNRFQINKALGGRFYRLIAIASETTGIYPKPQAHGRTPNKCKPKNH